MNNPTQNRKDLPFDTKHPLTHAKDPRLYTQFNITPVERLFASETTIDVASRIYPTWKRLE